MTLLAHTAIPVPETQRHALTVSPGSESLLFNEEILGVVVTRVQQSSLISSNLAVSRSLGRGRGRSSSSPLVNPSAAGSHALASRTVSAPPHHPVMVVVSASGVVRGRLLLPDLRVSESMSHHLA